MLINSVNESNPTRMSVIPRCPKIGKHLPIKKLQLNLLYRQLDVNLLEKDILPIGFKYCGHFRVQGGVNLELDSNIDYC